MLTFYCPNCWTRITEKIHICPSCGYVLDAFDQLAFEDKLLHALHHPIPERRMMAAQILGNLESQRAIPAFLEILQSEETDYFFLRTVLLAVVKIQHPMRTVLLEQAVNHPSTLVSNLAKHLLEQLSQNHPTDFWDRYTG
ncbi:MAG TPA: HEAT repeat domain-containing protein [Anaerolineaceae bacterium]|nr:HEAT repeat domain-containing protein [Anaerolineaceae bacterium]